MAEVAIVDFGLGVKAAWRLTFVEFRMLFQAHRRRLRQQHEHDTIRAWLNAQLQWKPGISLDVLLGHVKPVDKAREARMIMEATKNFNMAVDDQILREREANLAKMNGSGEGTDHGHR